MKKIKVLFVCMGNICRSPTAEGCFRKHLANNDLLNRFEVDSAGTIATHAGEQPDPRSRATASSKGIDLSFIKARQVVAGDFHLFDYIIAMDSDNLNNLKRLQDNNSTAKLSLLLSWDDNTDVSDVPDPYYGGSSGFEDVFNLLDRATLAFIKKIIQL